MKVYIPKPGGPWRIVFQVAELKNQELVLKYVAAGLGHTPRQTRRLDVYKTAHYRLHGEWPPRN